VSRQQCIVGATRLQLLYNTVKLTNSKKEKQQLREKNQLRLKMKKIENSLPNKNL